MVLAPVAWRTPLHFACSRPDTGLKAAVLSHLADTAFTIEPIPHLANEARARLGYDNVHVRAANRTLGLPEEAPFDAIVVTAGVESLPESYDFLTQRPSTGQKWVGSSDYQETYDLMTRFRDHPPLGSPPVDRPMFREVFRTH